MNDDESIERELASPEVRTVYLVYYFSLDSSVPDFSLGREERGSVCLIRVVIWGYFYEERQNVVRWGRVQGVYSRLGLLFPSNVWGLYGVGAA